MVLSIEGFRRLLADGRAALIGMLRAQPSDQELRAGLHEYQRMFGVLDAMTAAETAAPLELIDADRIKRISHGAGVADQDVIRVLFSYREYCEQLLRADWQRRRGSA